MSNFTSAESFTADSYDIVAGHASCLIYNEKTFDSAHVV
jgi:hypothetical protein